MKMKIVKWLDEFCKTDNALPAKTGKRRKTARKDIGINGAITKPEESNKIFTILLQ